MHAAEHDKPRRIVVAMSGGVDSSVVAGLLKQAGHDVVGITLQLYDHGAATNRKGACCAGQDIHDARQGDQYRRQDIGDGQPPKPTRERQGLGVSFHTVLMTRGFLRAKPEEIRRLVALAPSS